MIPFYKKSIIDFEMQTKYDFIQLLFGSAMYVICAYLNFLHILVKFMPIIYVFAVNIGWQLVS